MKFIEKLDSIRVCDDEKARRVLNVSSQRANISADEIENGVTIERLSEIGVPVFRYSTQVTIHGVIPDFKPESRPLGYKAIFRNQNGSLGVKYVAIDAAKKKLIVQAARLANGAAKFSAHINSSGLEMIQSTTDRESALAAFRSFPKHLIIGGLFAARGMFGEFYIVADVGAIESSNLWPFIAAMYGFNSQADLDSAQSAQDAEYAHLRAEHEKEYEAKLAARQTLESANKATALATLAAKFKPMTALPKGEFDFITVSNDGTVWFYIVRKKGFGLCYTSRKYVDGLTAKDFDTHSKMKRWQDRLPEISKRITESRVFAA